MRWKPSSEHLIATHVHDNRGRSDDHLLPFDGTIDWAGTLLAVQKIGYDGPFMFESRAAGIDEGDAGAGTNDPRADRSDHGRRLRADG